MKIAVLIPLLTVLVSGIAQTPDARAQTSCWATARTQTAMNQRAVVEFHRVEDEMNRTFRYLLARASTSNPAAASKIKAAQAAWIAYVDAQVDAMYAEQEKQLHYGTIYPMCVQMLRTRFAVQRTAELRAMMDPPDDAAACRGDRYSR